MPQFSADPDSRAEAMWWVARAGLEGGPTPLEPFRSALADDEPWIRAHAAEGLAQIGSRERAASEVDLAALENELAATADDANFVVRREAARALAAWRLGADRFARWQASSSPVEKELARVYAEVLAERR
ncbi:MAG: HEAT repeat domain-containing protein [Planctomycetota bacterium]